MKFKTRLRVTFISIILLPLLLTIMAFVMIAIYLMNYSQGLSLTDIDYSMMSENIKEFTNTTDQAYYVLLDQAKEDRSSLLFRSIFVIFFLRAEVLLSLMPSEELIRLL